MTTVPIPNGVMVELIYVHNTQRVQNVYAVTKGVPAVAADLPGLANTFRNWESATARSLRSNVCGLVQIDVTALDGPGAPVFSIQVAPILAGTVIGQAMPAFATLAVRHTSGLSGRSYRGRSYWIGLAQSQVTLGDEVAQSVTDNIVAAYNLLRTNLATAGWTFSIASRYSGVAIINGRRRAIPRAQGILTPVIGSVAERFIDTNRHRKLPFQV